VGVTSVIGFNFICSFDEDKRFEGRGDVCKLALIGFGSTVGEEGL
jgi:hypothetical protein